MEESMLDLYTPPKSKKDQLLDYIREKHWCKTSDIIRWGSEHYDNRAGRNARQLASEGKIRRMSKEEKRFRFGNTKEDVWVVI